MRLLDFTLHIGVEVEKIIRSISVMDKTFNWRVAERLWPDCFIKIWIPDRKQVPWIECDFQAPLSITPNLINRIITHFYNQLPNEINNLKTIQTTMAEINDSFRS